MIWAYSSTKSDIYLFIEDAKRVIENRKSKKRDSKTLTKSKRQKEKQSTQHYTGNLRLRITNLSNKGWNHVYEISDPIGAIMSEYNSKKSMTSGIGRIKNH